MQMVICRRMEKTENRFAGKDISGHVTASFDFAPEALNSLWNLQM
jgi:hypothetical protein